MQDNTDIHVRRIGSAGSPLRLTTDPGNDYNPVWSPDGRWIAFLRGQVQSGKSELRLVPPGWAGAPCDPSGRPRSERVATAHRLVSQ
jgi:Tol biopolymer transport system component